jgi:putative transposase
MDEKQLQALVNELAKNLKTPEDLNQFDRLLKKISVEAALNAEMLHHLGYDKNQPKPATNAIESLTCVIRYAIKKRKEFPTDDSVKKAVWLAIQTA